uniref:DUF1385 domain-containing protein n=1 Tax=candidate division CPR3 bacterium TaxID=2268181 RepID=A0A7C4M5E5_UNCC3
MAKTKKDIQKSQGGKNKKISARSVSKKSKETSKKIPLGGMAFSNGLMFRSRNNAVIAIYDNIGKIEIFSFPVKKLRKRFGLFFIPFLRGIFFILENIYLIFKTSGYKRVVGKKILSRMPRHERFYLKMDRFLNYIVYFLLVVGFFDYLYLRLSSKIDFGSNGFMYDFIFSFAYLVMFGFLLVLFYFGSRQKSELFSYHELEHRIINAYEKGKKVDSENILKSDKLHDRCSISVYFWSAVLLSFLISIFKINEAGWFLGILVSVGLFFVSFSISYEFIKIVSKSKLLSAVFIDPLNFIQYLSFHSLNQHHLKLGEIAFNEILRLEKEEK